MSEVDREAKDQLPKPVLERVREASRNYSTNVHGERYNEWRAMDSSFQAGALCLARILAEVPEGGHPPRMWCHDRSVVEPSVNYWMGFVREVQITANEIRYLAVSELQALRAKDLLEIEELCDQKEAALEELALADKRIIAERERVAKLTAALEKIAKDTPENTNFSRSEDECEFYIKTAMAALAGNEALRETAETPEGKALEGGE